MSTSNTPPATTESGSFLNTDSGSDLYDFGGSTIVINVQLLPIEGTSPSNRSCLVGVGLRNDPPLFRQVPLSELPLPPLLCEMLQQLEGELPTRKTAYLIRQEEKKRLEEERKTAANSLANPGKQPTQKIKTERPDSTPIPPFTLTLHNNGASIDTSAASQVEGKSQPSLF